MGGSEEAVVAAGWDWGCRISGLVAALAWAVLFDVVQFSLGVVQPCFE